MPRTRIKTFKKSMHRRNPIGASMKKHLPTLAVIAIMLISATLHFWDIDSIGDSNAYYTAAVESMTQSWHNFFFASAEPGGSVTVDKPPLGLQIETLFALVFGVSGFSTVLPNILAGIFSVPLMYHLVKKHFGTVAGLIAALVVATTPVVFAADRNNTQDGLLTFVLLLAAWAFIKAVESDKARWLFLGAVIVGLGFNIKMLQAYLPLPAFFALYFLGAKTGWLKKIGLTLVALAVMVAVSLSWALYVDSVPASERPYIGSSSDNTVMGLITGHNGTSRLFGGGGRNQPTPPSGPQAGLPAPDGFNPNASPDNPNGQVASVDGPQGGTPFSNETGSPGIFRFFQPPLGAEMSWLLPFALFALVVIAIQSKVKLPVESGAHLGLILWGGWLLTCVVLFSVVSGIFHAYYVVMLVPALGGVVGGGFGYLWQKQVDGHAGSGWWLTLGVAATVAFQIYLAWQYGVNEMWMPLAFVLVALGAILLFVSLFRYSPHLLRSAFSLQLSALLVIPLAWSALTVTDGNDSNLPAAYGVNGGRRNARVGVAAPAQSQEGDAGDSLLDYLEANTVGMKYLVAVESSQVGAKYVIATGRPVLYMGGFSGGDNVISADGLAQMVADGELRFVLFGMSGRNNKQEIVQWLQGSCLVVRQFNQQTANISQPQGPNQGGQVLYDCQ
ncbi:MAG: glycosyltransferase family 39 protein [Anaerolineaceae bacterium]|nr:MAG: glycosyltransferase family 39 protein [Anaerolineaceae bacterium]